ncbi:MAG: hypothetical protein M3162_02225 [Thermoproteota archaeon]|nr:hypothetical protein [Thermoproteota archaeon]
MFNKKEREQLQKNVLDVDRVNRIFEILRGKLNETQRESRQLIFKHHDDPTVKEDLARTQRINNHFDIILDLLEVTMKNVIHQNQILTGILQDVPQPGITKSTEESGKKDTKKRHNIAGDEFIETLKRHYEKTGRIKEE